MCSWKAHMGSMAATPMHSIAPEPLTVESTLTDDRSTFPQNGRGPLRDFRWYAVVGDQHSAEVRLVEELMRRATQLLIFC